jgi:endoglucanase
MRWAQRRRAPDGKRSRRGWHRSRFLVLAAVLAIAVYAGVVLLPGQSGTPAPELRVVGNRLVDAEGHPFQLRGVNRSGAQSFCVRGRGIFDGPTDESSVAAMREWNINSVRIPLNSQCWLGNEQVSTKFSGQQYRRAVADYVSRLNRAGMVAVLDLHVSAPRHLSAERRRHMADADQAVPFWRSVAEFFSDEPGVLFDLYNEPHDVSWSCWRDGCSTPGGWRAAGMQELLDAVRGAGARQPVLVGGIGWANDLSGWLRYRPRDPEGQLVAAFHVYPFMTCVERDCWEKEVSRVAEVVPVVTGEVGGSADCESSDFVASYLRWADDRGISWLAWTWNTWKCDSNHALISAYDGSPTPYGTTVRQALRREPDA